jgi:hypothetical protein
VSDQHFTSERAAWVLARAGHLHGARRRGQRLVARSRRLTRDTAGVGDDAVTSVVTHARARRIALEGEEHKGARLAWAATYELGRVLVVGPAFGAAWVIYGAWYRLVPRTGPMSLLRAGIVTAVLGLITLVTAMVAQPLSVVGWWVLLQPLVAGLRLMWLVWAYGWTAVRAGSSSAPQRRAMPPVTAAPPMRPAPTPMPAPTPAVPAGMPTPVEPAAAHDVPPKPTAPAPAPPKQSAPPLPQVDAEVEEVDEAEVDAEDVGFQQDAETAAVEVEETPEPADYGRDR